MFVADLQRNLEKRNKVIFGTFYSLERGAVVKRFWYAAPVEYPNVFVDIIGSQNQYIVAL